jgi:hypothetical protein
MESDDELEILGKVRSLVMELRCAQPPAHPNLKSLTQIKGQQERLDNLRLATSNTRKSPL